LLRVVQVAVRIVAAVVGLVGSVLAQAWL